MYKKVRKPPQYTKEQLDLAIELASKGTPIKDIVTEIISDEYEFWVYREHDHEFGNAFERARQEGYHSQGDALLTAHKEETDVQRARLKSDNIKWLLSKRHPQVYGDKVDIHVSQTIDIGAALAEAKKRALPGASKDEVIDITPTPAIKAK